MTRHQSAPVVLLALSGLSDVAALPLMFGGHDTPPAAIAAVATLFAVASIGAAIGLTRGQSWARSAGIGSRALDVVAIAPVVFFSGSGPLVAAGTVTIVLSLAAIAAVMWRAPVARPDEQAHATGHSDGGGDGRRWRAHHRSRPNYRRARAQQRSRPHRPGHLRRPRAMTETTSSSTAAQPRRRRPDDYDGVYDGSPRWDIGRPQPALSAAARAGGLCSRVLDVGCGTGEHALMAAAMGFRATGVDTSATAIAIARRKAATRRLDVEFVVWNALDLPALGATFGTVIDSGLFHVLDDVDRATYVAGLGQVVEVGGRCHLLCFADRQPGDDGPRRISANEIRATFAAAWHVDTIDAVRIETTNPFEPIEAWRAALIRQ